MTETLPGRRWRGPTDTLTDLMLFGIAISAAVVALVSTTILMLTPRALRRSAEDESRQRREEGYRLDYLRPYIWMLTTWPRRVAFSLSGLALVGFLLWAYRPN